jgi:hypothetical protein
LDRLQSEYNLKHQRRADGGIYRRMRAGKEKCESSIREVVVGYRRDGARVTGEFGDFLKVVAAGDFALSAHVVDQLASSDRQQPSFGIGGAALNGPYRKCSSERVGKSVFRGGQVAGTCSQECHKFCAAAASSCLSDIVCLLMHHLITYRRYSQRPV